jgi:hypothetical protein
MLETTNAISIKTNCATPQKSKKQHQKLQDEIKTKQNIDGLEELRK